MANSRLSEDRPLQLKFLFRAARTVAILAPTAIVGLPALLSLCSAPAEAAARLTLASGGVSRTAVLVERDRLKLRRRPLIIVLQRSGGVGVRARRHHGLEQIAGAKPIFVYPEALGAQWPVSPGPDADRDLSFLHILADHLIDQGRVDPRRIFVVGIGSGGPLAYRAACNGVGRRVAGFAAIVSAMPQDLSACALSTPLPYIAVNNAQDPRIPYSGGKAAAGDANYDAFGAEQSLETFAKINGCGARRDDKRFPERKDGKGLRGSVLAYSGCKAPTELIRIDAASHRLPGRSPEASDATAEDFDADRAIWEFLQRNGA
jgi:polyhydroxybutyrate depolymerase